MRAVTLDYTTRDLSERSVAEPVLIQPDEVLFRVHEVGICGTDRELARFQFGYPPPGDAFLIPGHEALGQVLEAGPGASALRPGDWVTPMIRRACSPPCDFCRRGRRDLCVTGNYTERGIFGAHGYLSEYAVDRAEDLVRVPEETLDCAILIEPLSVVEKAVASALRYHEPEARTALVLGAGPIGILAALVLKRRGLEVSLHSLEPEDHPRVKIVRDAGIRYGVSTADVIIEATGSPEAALAGINGLAPNGVLCVLGALSLSGDIPLLNLVTENQVVFGSVNASPQAFADAVTDLSRLDRGILRRLIRRVGLGAFRDTVLQPPGEAAKLVHVVSE